MLKSMRLDFLISLHSTFCLVYHGKIPFALVNFKVYFVVKFRSDTTSDLSHNVVTHMHTTIPPPASFAMYAVHMPKALSPIGCLLRNEVNWPTTCTN